MCVWLPMLTQIAREVQLLGAERQEGQEILAQTRKQQQELADKVAATTAQLEVVREGL